MPRFKSRLLVILVALPLVAFALLEARFFASYFTDRRKPSLYLIPDDYVGWVVARYGDPSCPALPEESGYILHRITGEDFCTATAMPQGWGEDVFANVSRPQANIDGDHLGFNRIWHKFITDDPKPGSNARYFLFYVGQQLRGAKLKSERERIAAKIGLQKR